MKWEKFIQAGFRMPFYFNLFVEGQCHDLLQPIGWQPSSWLVTIERQYAAVYHTPETPIHFVAFLRPRLTDPNFHERFFGAFERTDQELLTFSRTLSYYDYLDDELADLAVRLKEFVRLFRAKFSLYGIPKLADDAVGILLPEFAIALPTADFLTLTSPQQLSDYQRERLALLTCAKRVRANHVTDLFRQTNAEIIDQLGRHYPALYDAIERHTAEFAWVSVSHHIQPMTLDHTLEKIRVALADSSAEDEFQQLMRYPEETRQCHVRLHGKHSLTAAQHAVITFMRQLRAVNERRKAAMSKAILWSYPLFRALADRLDIDTISLRQLTAAEILEAIQHGALSKSDRRVITQRLEAYACLFADGRVINFAGENARAVMQHELGQITHREQTPVNGKVANSGHAKGRVRLILSEHQIERLEEGEILVTSMTDPHMLPAMKKAAAIVTDEGGIMCHAAIMSRELSKPCVVGTKIATKVLKDGDLVEVDAEEGVVRLLASKTDQRQNL